MLPNPLNIYESYSYDIEVAMSPYMIGKNSGAQLPPGAGILIAATGRTANYYVDRLESVSLPSNKEANLNTKLTNFTIDISEPMGFTLLERYFIACVQMGWSNPLEAVIYVSISFNGWLPNGRPSPKTHKTTWRCLVTDIKTDLEHTGSKYKMHLVVLDEVGFDTSILTIQRQVNSEVKQTLEDTLKEFGKRLTEVHNNLQNPDNKVQEPFVQYEVKLGQRLKNLNLKMYINPQVGANTSKRGADGKFQNRATAGDLIETAIIRICLNAIDIADHLIPKIKPDGTKESTDRPGTELGKWLLVQSQISYGKYNAALGKYNKKVVYTIDSHLRPDVEPVPPGTENNRSRAQALIGNGLLNKRYDYIFTGKNTEVLELKLDFNATFSMLVTNYHNTYNEQQIASDNESVQKENQDKKKRKMPTSLKSGGGFPSFGGGLGGRYLEELPVFPSLGSMLKFDIQAIADQERITRGFNDFNDMFTNGKKIKLSEWWALAKPTSANADLNQTPSMSSISMTVRGDPYWICVSDITNNYQNAQGNPSSIYSNIQNGTQYFYLEFKLPETYSVSSGLPARLGRLTFTGIYQMVNVRSIFEGGKFTQVLDAILAPDTLGVKL